MQRLARRAFVVEGKAFYVDDTIQVPTPIVGEDTDAANKNLAPAVIVGKAERDPETPGHVDIVCVQLQDKALGSPTKIPVSLIVENNEGEDMAALAKEAKLG